MPNITRHSVASERYAPAHHGHGHHGHCSLHCPYCGPDAGAWAVGEVIVGLVVALLTIVGWLARHPATALVLSIALAAAWLVAGPR